MAEDNTAKELPNFYAVRRVDGEDINDEYSWLHCKGPEDYSIIEELYDYNGEDPIEFEICEMRPRRVSTRILPKVEDNDG